VALGVETKVSLVTMARYQDGDVTSERGEATRVPAPSFDWRSFKLGELPGYYGYQLFGRVQTTLPHDYLLLLSYQLLSLFHSPTPPTPHTKNSTVNILHQYFIQS
jgi:hypothetical protein